MSGRCLVAQAYLTLENPLGCSQSRLLFPWDFLGKNTEVGCHFLLQGIFPTQGLNSGQYWQVNSLPLSHLGNQQMPKASWNSHSAMGSCKVCGCTDALSYPCVFYPSATGPRATGTPLGHMTTLSQSQWAIWWTTWIDSSGVLFPPWRAFGVAVWWEWSGP